jgi:hypothetical protein
MKYGGTIVNDESLRVWGIGRGLFKAIVDYRYE